MWCRELDAHTRSIGPGGWPPAVQVGLDGADPAVHAQLAGPGPEAVQPWRGHVHGDHVRLVELPDQGQGAGAGPAAQVEDPARRRIAGQLTDPGDHLGQIGVQHLRVQVQELGQGRLVGPALGIVLVLVPGAMVRMAFHGLTLRFSCAVDIESCL